MQYYKKYLAIVLSATSSNAIADGFKDGQFFVGASINIQQDVYKLDKKIPSIDASPQLELIQSTSVTEFVLNDFLPHSVNLGENANSTFPLISQLYNSALQKPLGANLPKYLSLDSKLTGLYQTFNQATETYNLDNSATNYQNVLNALDLIEERRKVFTANVQATYNWLIDEGIETIHGKTTLQPNGETYAITFKDLSEIISKANDNVKDLMTDFINVISISTAKGIGSKNKDNLIGVEILNLLLETPYNIFSSSPNIDQIKSNPPKINPALLTWEKWKQIVKEEYINTIDIAKNQARINVINEVKLIKTSSSKIVPSASLMAGYSFNQGNFGFITELGIDLTSSKVGKNDKENMEAEVKNIFHFYLTQKVGYEFTESSLTYITAGFGLKDYKAEYKGVSSTLNVNESKILPTFVIGAGYEHQVTNSLAVFTEFNHIMTLSKLKTEIGDFSMRSEQIRVGVRWYL
jgi:opacity protein-like surface antigen